MLPGSALFGKIAIETSIPNSKRTFPILIALSSASLSRHRVTGGLSDARRLNNAPSVERKLPNKHPLHPMM